MKTGKMGTVKTDAIEFLEAFISLTGCVFTRGYVEEEDIGLALAAISLLEKAEDAILVNKLEMERMLYLARQRQQELEDWRAKGADEGEQ